jgi:hypothetical protein
MQLASIESDDRQRCFPSPARNLDTVHLTHRSAERMMRIVGSTIGKMPISHPSFATAERPTTELPTGGVRNPEQDRITP